MILRNRVIWSDNGVIKDISDLMNNHVSGSKVIPFVASQDYLFLGSDAPFNNRWFEILVHNTNSATWSVDIWDGSQWQPCAEVIDLTKDLSTLTKTLSQSGRIAWVPDPQKPSWGRDDTYNNSGKVITGLGTVKIYNLYWVRMKLNADISASTEIAFIGHKFANDEDLYALYPEFETNEAKTRFATGTVTWDQIHFEAAKCIIRDLKSEQVITSENQIIEWEVFRLPAIHKAANLIYFAYGSDWKEEFQSTSNEYSKALNADIFNVDLDNSASLSPKEMQSRTGTLYR